MGARKYSSLGFCSKRFSLKWGIFLIPPPCFLKIVNKLKGKSYILCGKNIFKRPFPIDIKYWTFAEKRAALPGKKLVNNLKLKITDINFSNKILVLLEKYRFSNQNSIQLTFSRERKLMWELVDNNLLQKWLEYEEYFAVKL